MGYPTPIQPIKQPRIEFDNVIRYMLDHIDTIDFMVATHSEEFLAVGKTDRRRASRNHRVFLATLWHERSHHLQLIGTGLQRGKIRSYGAVETMMPYLFRRAAKHFGQRADQP